MTRTCPPEHVLSDMLADRLSPDVESTIEDHLASCGRCREVLDQLTGWTHQDDDSPAADEDTALPQRLVATVAARLARAVPVDALGRTRSRTTLPTVPGYEMLAEIGRGGSGVVYRAVDRNLARTVALKLLRDRSGPEAHERFRREAAALAQLRHPNIVQIYGVGDNDGQPFLALEYVAGGSLARFTSGEPQEPFAAAGIIEALARGVGVANQAGLVHRDLKPANILLEAQTGGNEAKALSDFIPKVTDFGVVKSLATDPGLTDTRDFLGTPSYMAPEQTGAGKQVDHRADVYALGAILYELLTGRPPFRAATPIDTLVQVAFDEPVPPSRVQPRLPRDLETVCLKCLEKDPARRYQSAEALADDLARFREGRPVQARPVRLPARAWRWCRRSPARAAVAGLAASFILVLAVGGPIIAEREHILREEADSHEATALAEKEHARQNLDLASKALDETLGGLVVNARLRAYGMDDIRADMLRGAVPYLEEFASREEGSPDIQARQARASIQLANVDVRDGHFDQAQEQFRRGIAIFERLSNASDGARFLGELSGAHMEYGRFFLEVGNDPVAAERQFREALRITDSVATDDRGTRAQQDYKAVLIALLATVPATNAAELQERIALNRRALRIRKRLVSDNPDRADLRRYATMTALNLALALQSMNQLDEAADLLTWALAEENRLAGAAKASMDGPRMKANIEGTLGAILFDLGRRDEALRHVGEAARTTEFAAVLFPIEADFLAKSLSWHNALANMLESSQNWDQAIAVRRKAVALAERIVEAAPNVGAHRDGLLAVHLTLAEQLFRRGMKEADSEFAVTAAVGHQMPPAPPNSEQSANRAECFRRLAGHELSIHRAAEALAWLNQSVALIDVDPKWANSTFRKNIEEQRALALEQLGRAAEAASARARAEQCRPAPEAPAPALEKTSGPVPEVGRKQL